MFKLPQLNLLRAPLVLGLMLLFLSSSKPSVAQESSNKHKPLKVFLLVGQSNMQGHADVRTLEHVGMDDATLPILNEIQDQAGTAKVFNQIRINYLSANGVKKGPLTTGFGANEKKIGPELTFGIYLQKQLNEPILIIKTAWGGKSLNTDFRPPSAGPFKFREDELERFKKQGKNVDEIRKQKAEATGHYYRLMISHVKQVLANLPESYPDYDPKFGFELSGFVWFQGWNDMVNRGFYPNRDQPNGYSEYSRLLAHLIRDVRKDLNAPQLPFVIGVMGAGGPTDKYTGGQKRYRGIHQNFRDAMAAPANAPEFKETVMNVLTEAYWDMQLVELRAKQNEANQELRKRQKAENLDRNSSRQLRDELMAKYLTEQEREILQKGVSNAEFHYLGSAKIMTQIGKGFAEAMWSLIQRNN